MDFKNYLQTSAKEIEDRLNKFLERWYQEVEHISPKLLPVVKTFIDGCAGGKRLRGSLVRIGFDLTGSKPTREILEPACALEVFQTAILAHDDIIDLSPTRRGKPTIYMSLGGDHYGISQTIALGDIGFFLANRIIAESAFPADRKNLALRSFADLTLKTGVGQMLDIELPHLGGIKNEGDALTIFRLKTAWYTIIGPLQLGAILGGGSQKLLDDLEKFGENLGIAFQIQDDILGVFGNEKTLGKSVTSDIEEGKNTLLITQATKLATPAQKQVLDKYYGKPFDSAQGLRGVEMIKQVFVDTGSLDYSRQKAVKYVSLAKKVITRITKDPKYQRLLTEMADFLVERDR